MPVPPRARGLAGRRLSVRRRAPRPRPPPPDHRATTIAATPAVPASATLAGRVVTADGGAVSEPRVTVRAGADAEAAAVEVDGDGRFTFSGKVGQTLTVRAQSAGYEPATETVTLAAPSEAEVTLTLQRRLPSGQIRGLVRSFKGVGLDAEIKIDPSDPTLPTPGGIAGRPVRGRRPPRDVPGDHHRAGLRDTATARGRRTERRHRAERRSAERAMTTRRGPGARCWRWQAWPPVFRCRLLTARRAGRDADRDAGHRSNATTARRPGRSRVRASRSGWAMGCERRRARRRVCG